MDSAQIQEFISNHMILSAAFAVVAVLLVANEIARLRRGYKELTPAQAVPMLNQADAIVVDLRSSNDFLKGHIINGKNFSTANLTADASIVGGSKDRPVLVCCANGTHSGRAAGLIVKAGYSNVAVLKGGVTAWKADNFPLESRDSGKTAKSGKSGKSGKKKSGKAAAQQG